VWCGGAHLCVRDGDAHLSVSVIGGATLHTVFNQLLVLEAKDEFCTKIGCSHKTEYEKSGLSVHRRLLHIYVQYIIYYWKVQLFFHKSEAKTMRLLYFIQ
jgi:hypothetical protein